VKKFTTPGLLVFIPQLIIPILKLESGDCTIALSVRRPTSRITSFFVNYISALLHRTSITSISSLTCFITRIRQTLRTYLLHQQYNDKTIKRYLRQYCDNEIVTAAAKSLRAAAIFIQTQSLLTELLTHSDLTY